MSFEIIPAIDLRAGRVVRLYQGNYARQTNYDVEPATLAKRYAAHGSRWLHVVDLDGARCGRSAHTQALRELATAGLNVQAGGGVRSEDDLTSLWAAGARRVVVGSLAIREPDTVCAWLDRYGPQQLVIALDTRWRDGAWRLPSAGWEREEAATLDELAPRYAAAGARHLLCTDIDRDGTLSGPNLELLAHLHSLAPGMALQVSGGVRGLDEIRRARAGGAAGVIVGRALLDGRFNVAEALAC